MANAPGIGAMIDIRSSGVLMDYVHAHEPCAPGAANHARRRMLFGSFLEERRSSAAPGISSLGPRTGGCCSGGMPYNGSGSVFPRSYPSFGPCGGLRSNVYGGSHRASLIGSNRGTTRNGDPFDAGGYYPVEEEDEDYSKFDRGRDWITCLGSVVIVACVIGLIHSFAVFAPAIQHHYSTGLVETILVGSLSYFALLITIPAAVCLNNFLEHRWTAIFGMLMFFIGLLLDALTLHWSTLYISHIIFMGAGGSCAYTAAMSIVSHHFRRRLVYALCAITCSGSIGTIIFYLLSNLMMSYVSYLWTRLCLAVIVLVCMGACQTFPKRSKSHPWHRSNDPDNNGKLKACVQKAAYEREQKLMMKRAARPEDEAPKSFLCVCVCDISVWTDISFLLWAVISFIALITMFIPYLFLTAYAYTVGEDYAVGLICWFCVASILARIALINSNDHTFGFNRTVFQIATIASGIFYIFLNWAETYGWILVWGLAVGVVEGVMCIVIPRVTLQCIPAQWLASSWRFVGIIHSFAVIVGPMIMMSVYYNTLEYGPALIAIGVAQIIAGILAFLLPNEERDSLENMEEEGGGGGGGVVGSGLGGNNYSSSSSSYYSSYATSGGGLASSGRYAGAGPYSSTLAGSYYSKDSGNYSGLRAGQAECFHRPYSNECPICSQIGPVPGCSGCGMPTATSYSSSYGGSYDPLKRPKPCSMEEIEEFLARYKNNCVSWASAMQPTTTSHKPSSKSRSKTHHHHSSNNKSDKSTSSKPPEHKPQPTVQPVVPASKTTSKSKIPKIRTATRKTPEGDKTKTKSDKDNTDKKISTKKSKEKLLSKKPKK